MDIKKIISYNIIMEEQELKELQSILQEKQNTGTATPTQTQLYTEIMQNL